MKVLLADALPDDVVARLTATGADVDARPSLSAAALPDALAASDAQVLVVRSTRVTAAAFEAGPRLALVVRAGAGVNTIDLEAASARAVFVANCPGKNAVAVAELTMGHLLNLDRRIADHVDALRQGRWAKKAMGGGRGLHGRTLAVIGTGQIGREVITRALAFGMKVRAWSRSLDADSARELGVAHATSVVDACEGADAVTVHVALTADTRGLVATDALAALADGAYVINTARGGVIDEAALLDAIASKGLRAGLDVFADEPDADGAFDTPVTRSPSVYGTHHTAASTDQASESVADETVRIVADYIRTGRAPNTVNLAAVSPATHLLVVRHADRVGVLAAVLMALRTADINVHEMENIVFDGAQAACASIRLDQAPSRETLAQIEQTTHVFAATLVPLA